MTALAEIRAELVAHGLALQEVAAAVAALDADLEATLSVEELEHLAGVAQRHDLAELAEAFSQAAALRRRWPIAIDPATVAAAGDREDADATRACPGGDPTAPRPAAAAPTSPRPTSFNT